MSGALTLSELTTPQRRMYCFVLEAWALRKPMPSVRDMADRAGLSIGRVHGHLQRLHDMGYLVKFPGQHRAWQPMVVPALCDHCEGSGLAADLDLAG